MKNKIYKAIVKKIMTYMLDLKTEANHYMTPDMPSYLYERYDTILHIADDIIHIIESECDAVKEEVMSICK